MRLVQIRLQNVGPFADLTFPFCDGAGVPRPSVVIVGGGGVGKTALLAAIAATRPGYCVPLARPPAKGDPPAIATADWQLGDDDSGRPHPLRVASPSASSADDGDSSLARRREQALFDKRAAERGFVLVSFSGARWFSRAPALLSAPERTVGRYDARTPASFDDATRGDLARETKQALCYATIGAALAQHRAASERRDIGANAFEEAMRRAVDALVGLMGYRYHGVDGRSFEPMFERDGGKDVAFDDIPTGARHLVAMGALTVRALAAAYPDRDPAYGEGVVLIDDAELRLEPAARRALAPALERALPRVQWILASTSTDIALGSDTGSVLALRSTPRGSGVELYEGPHAIVH